MLLFRFGIVLFRSLIWFVWAQQRICHRHKAPFFTLTGFFLPFFSPLIDASSRSVTRREARSCRRTTIISTPSVHSLFIRHLSCFLLCSMWMMVVVVHQYFSHRHHSLRLSWEERTNDRLLQVYYYWTIIQWSNLEHHRESIDIFLIIIGQLDPVEHSTACSCRRTSRRFTLVRAPWMEWRRGPNITSLVVAYR